MSVLNIQLGAAGLDNIVPRLSFIETNNTVAEVLATGYLNSAVQQGYSFSEYDMCLVSTKTTPSAATTQVGWFEISIVGANTSLVPSAAPGTVALPTVANQIAYATDAIGSLAAAGLATALFNAGDLSAGISGTAGDLISYPATLARGSLRLTAANSAGNTITTITNASQAAARTYTIPDGGQAASSFLLTDNATTQTIATGNLALTVGDLIATAGDLVSGAAAGGFAGSLILYLTTAANGSLRMLAVNSAG